jgi:thiamine-monophosphate kinase
VADRERAILKDIRKRATRMGGLRVGIGDDAAVLSVRCGEEIVVTTDFSLEDVHFRRGWHAPEAVGHKCLARGLSDIAAMGARPVAAFVSLAVPRSLTQGQRSWVDRFYDGLLALAERWQVSLAGGDLAQLPGGAHARAAADIVVVGAVERRRTLLRSGAKAGDALYVTGTLGGAAAELRAVTRSPRRFRNITVATPEHPHFFPQPRIAIGRALVRKRLANAAIDISDGLSVDLEHLCVESGLHAEVDAAILPFGNGATLNDVLHGGDDYELLFTTDVRTHVPRRIGGVLVTRIGRMLRRRAGRPEMTLQKDGQKSELRADGWQHF